MFNKGTNPYAAASNATKNQDFFNNRQDAQEPKQESTPVPRIPANLISGYCNQTISLFGRALGVDQDNGKVHIQCPISGETLIVALDTGVSADFSVNNQFILKIGANPQNIVVTDHSSLTDNFDFNSYEFLMNLMQSQCRPLFC